MVIGGVLISSGFFSGSEASLLTISEAEIEGMSKATGFRGKALQKVTDNMSRAVIAIVIMNNVVNIVGSILVGQMVIGLYGNAMLAITTTALTFGVIVFSEIIPKTLGIHYAHRISIVVAPIILMLTYALMPAILIMEFITNLLKGGEGRQVGTEDQIRSLVTIGRKEGHIETDEGQLIHRAFILNDKKAGDIMTNLKDIIGVTADMTVTEAADKIAIHPYSRYPIFGASIHEVEGVVMNADVLEALSDERQNVPVLDIKRETLVVQSDMPADDLLRLFRDQHIHLAVVQEDDHTVGLVTLEDVIEELVGEIEDEVDVENQEA